MKLRAALTPLEAHRAVASIVEKRLTPVLQPRRMNILIKCEYETEQKS
jgi:hypothetical protein